MFRTCLAIVMSTLLLSSCGGGGNEPEPAQAGSQTLKADAVLAPDARILGATDGQLVRTVSSGHVEFPVTAAVTPNSTVIAGGQAYRIIARASSASAGFDAFTTRPPKLSEMYSSLKLSGQTTTSMASAVATDRKTALSMQRALGFSPCIATDNVAGLPGFRCNFSFEDDAYPMLKLDGFVGVAARLDFNNWDMMTNTGSGSIKLGFAGDIAYKLKQQRQSQSTPEDTCTSNRPQVSGGRARVGTIVIPTNLPGITINLPVCLAFDAKSGVSGTIFKLSESSQIEIGVGSGAPPRLASQVPSTSRSNVAAEDEVWQVFSSDSASLSTALVAIEASAGLALELGLEIEASRAIAVGFTNAVSGRVSVGGEVAPAVINASSSLGSIRANPKYCLSVAASANYDLTAFADIPALQFFGANSTVTRKLASVEVWKQTAPLGTCNTRVDTVVSMVTAPTTDYSARLTATVVKADSASGRLWDDKQATGIVDFRDDNGAVLCSATLEVGSQASCTHNFGAPERSTGVTASYRGDGHFNTSISTKYSHQVRAALVHSCAAIPYTREPATCRAPSVRFRDPGMIIRANVTYPAADILTVDPGEGCNIQFAFALPTTNSDLVLGGWTGGGNGLYGWYPSLEFPFPNGVPLTIRFTRTGTVSFGFWARLDRTPIVGGTLPLFAGYPTCSARVQ